MRKTYKLKETSMTLSKTLSILTVIIGSCLITIAKPSLATTDYPSKTITNIVPFPPGGLTDITGRIISEALSKKLNQTIVIDNKSGAAGSIGISQVIRSKPDGYTLGSITSPALLAPHILPKAPYDLRTDIKPIGIAYITPLVLVINPKYTPEITDMPSLIATGKKGSLNYSTGGLASTAHLTMELIKKELNLDITHIPFRGSSPAVTAILSGELHFMFSDLASVLTHIKAGTLKPLAVSTTTRIDELPDTPTLTEVNIHSAKAASWGGMLAPKATPDDIIDKLSTALKEVLEDDNVQKRLKAAGAYPHYADSKTMQATINSDTAIWSEVIKENNLKQN